MAKFTIVEKIIEHTEIEADSAQEALDIYINTSGHEPEFVEVSSRWVENEDGQTHEVEDS